MKYLFSLILIILAFRVHQTAAYAAFQVLELLIIFALSNLLVKRRPIGGCMLNALLLLILNAQVLVLYFGSTYISRVMLTNLFNIEDLAGNALVYGASAAILLIITFLPIRYIDLRRLPSTGLLSIILACELVLTMVSGSSFSPGFAIYTLVQEEIAYREMAARIAEQGDSSSEWYNPQIRDARTKDETLTDQPNVILIFTEGLSQHIIDDERDIMPNVRAWQEKSLRFENYYNHTFATFRGLEGQLYSGYQVSDTDENQLISLQSILSDNGYATAFINPEPSHRQFSKYIYAFEFDQVIGDPASTYSGPSNSMTDRENYEILLDTALSLSQEDQPFFLATYTFGTHASFNSPDEVFGDGSVAELNKFWNCDVQFGKFMEAFENSALADNTIIVFTADHATYADLYYNEAFPDAERANAKVDEVPLFIYYDGITPETVEANGKNSLNLAPTLLDYLDITAENYFMGYTIFYSTSTTKNFDMIFYDASNMLSTEGGSIHELTDEELTILRTQLESYCSAALNGPLMTQ